MSYSRRTILRSALGYLLLPAFLSKNLPVNATAAEELSWRHGVSQFGQLKYPPQFPHFEYVNPQAPKFGRVRQGAFGTYDNFNMVVSGVKGNLATGTNLIYEQLLISSLDEPSAEYGLIAEAVSYSSDFSTVSFRLRPQARWHDGRPITPHDVVFSFHAFKTNSPQLSALPVGEGGPGERRA